MKKNEKFWVKLFSGDETVIVKALIMREFVPNKSIKIQFSGYDENQKTCLDCKRRATERCPATYYNENDDLVCVDLGGDGYCCDGDFENA